MINKIKYIESKQYNPYPNLALEEYLLNHVEKGECILYLWQNEKTVVIGKNQNPWKECRLKELEEDEGRLVRRLSGGGAVFHDLGNLNFTFLLKEEDYDLEKQLSVIVKAVQEFGIPAKLSGRNDITANERKFSGNAFYSNGENAYHHGTILIDVNKQDLSKYLNVSRDKLVTKGVDSVKSRIVNLTDFNEEVTVPRMKDELKKAFSYIYGLPVVPIPEVEISSEDMEQASKKFASWEWNYGKKMKFTDTITKRFEWGDFTLELLIENGIIADSMAYSDAMDIWYMKEIPKKLSGCIFSSKEMINRIEQIETSKAIREKMAVDIMDLFLQENI